jgi:hypothetical protein
MNLDCMSIYLKEKVFDSAFYKKPSKEKRHAKKLLLVSSQNRIGSDQIHIVKSRIVQLVNWPLIMFGCQITITHRRLLRVLLVTTIS